MKGYYVKKGESCLKTRFNAEAGSRGDAERTENSFNKELRKNKDLRDLLVNYVKNGELHQNEI